MFKQVVCIAVLALLAVASAAEMNIPEKDLQSIFTGYMQRHNKVYAREEFFHRYGVFKANYAKVLAHNALPEEEQKGVKFGTNKLTDLTPAEYKKLLGLKKDGAWGAGNDAMPEGEFDDATSLDWRTKGAVNAVKDQGQCGGCWAFSAVASTEAAIFIAGNKLPSLSEQELIDCSTDAPYNCEGCNGCLMHTAFQYIIDKKGLCTEKEYPFTGEDGTCDTKQCTTKKVPIKSYKNVTCDDENFCDEPLIAANETTMLTYVNKGVLSIALEADSDVFQNYESGVLDDDSCGTQLDHGVAIVGYGTDSKQGKYWLVRNSWGASWGEEGYIRIAQGKNMCGIALYSNQPYAK